MLIPVCNQGYNTLYQYLEEHVYKCADINTGNQTEFVIQSAMFIVVQC